MYEQSTGSAYCIALEWRESQTSGSPQNKKNKRRTATVSKNIFII
jgi:hypothetical protein